MAITHVAPPPNFVLWFPAVPKPRVTFDRHRIPGLWADDDATAYHALGWAHGWYRTFQVKLMHTAASGVLARRLAPVAMAVDLDALALRLDLPGRGACAARLGGSAHLDAYLRGLHEGLLERGPTREERLLRAELPLPTAASTHSALLLAAYLGLAQGQERMERALVQAVQHGADVDLLASMFAPHLEGLDAARVRSALLPTGPGFTAQGAGRASGSNAWAVDGSRTASGTPMLCGDPHLHVGQLPAVLMDTRVAFGREYWLGASIPGLPGLAVGRNRHLAWAGTFGVADNVDHFLGAPTEPREARLERRFLRPLSLRFFDSPLGTSSAAEGLSVGWAALTDVHEALRAYMALPLARSLEEGSHALHRAHTLSLHFVLADRHGVRYQQAGVIPRRDWSGLYPVPYSAERWGDTYRGPSLPSAPARDGLVASANEARPASDGGVLATLAQPRYRLERIEALLRARRDHDVATMQALQLDLYSSQAERLVPHLLRLGLPKAHARFLHAWDRRYTHDSLGATVFEQAYRAALSALAPHLGGPWFEEALRTTELRTWWAEALDRTVAAPSAPVAATLQRRLSELRLGQVGPWGEAQTFRMRHLLFGGLPTWLGLDRGDFALPGSLATVRQGNTSTVDGQALTVAPAYRMVTELGADEIHSALPGGVDGDFRASSYAAFVQGWAEGAYRLVRPPQHDRDA